MTYTAYASETDPPHAFFNAPGWTDERVQRLKDLWAAGYSCSHIANELGYITRNAVIGKVTRLGLERRGLGGNYNGNQHSKPGPKPRPRVANPLGATATLPRARVRHESPDIKAMRCAEITPLNVSLFDLEHAQCRFPYGDGPWFFCGHAVVKERSYCEAHFALTTKPTRAE